MKGMWNSKAIGPEIPPGGKKRCTSCREYKDVTNFSTVMHKLKSGVRKRYWRSKCKPCYNKERKDKKQYATTWWKEETSARDKAATRLIKLVPKLFIPIFKEELIKEYRKLGLTDKEIAARLRYRTRYLQEYVDKQ